MPGTMKLNPKELLELIEGIEAIGGDATEFRTLLAEVSQESQYKTKVFRQPVQLMRSRLHRSVSSLRLDISSRTVSPTTY